MDQDFILLLILFVLFICIFSLYYYIFYTHFPWFTKGQAYFEFSFFLSTLSNGQFLLSFIILVVFPTYLTRQVSWQSYHPSVKFFVISLATMMAWVLSTYDYSLFFNHWHWPERLLLIILCALLFFHPGFIWSYLCLLLIMLSQLNFAPKHFNNIHFLPPMLYLALFSGHVLLTSWRRINSCIFYYAMICSIGSAYFFQGMSKALWGTHFFEWALTYKLELGWGLAQFHGWPDPFFPSLAPFITRILEMYDQFLVFILFLMEICIIFIFLSPVLTIYFLLFFIVFHIAAFFFSGAFFWIWILSHGFFLISYIWFRNKLFLEFNPRGIFLISLVLISFPFLVQLYPRNLAWWETRYNYKLQLIGIGLSGNKYPLSKTIFGPHHFSLTMHADWDNYLINKRVLPVGTRTAQTARIINSYISKHSKLSNLKSFMGKNPYDPKKSKAFDNFVKRIVNNFQSLKNDQIRWIRKIQPPMFYYVNYHPKRYTLSELPEPIKFIKIKFTEGIYQNNKNIKINESIVRNIST